MYYTIIMAKKMELKSQKRMLESPLKIPAPVRIYTHSSIWCDKTKKKKGGTCKFLGDLQLEEIQKDVDNRYGFGND